MSKECVTTEWRNKKVILNQIDHVAIAVHDLEAAIEYYGKAFGAEVCHRENVEKDAVEEALIRVGESYIQLTTGTSPDSPISIFLEKEEKESTTSGIESKIARKALDSLVAAGGKAIDQEPRPGSRGTTVAFIHPKGSFGTLIELVQENPEE